MTTESKALALTIVKQNLGLSSDVRDAYITSIIEGVVSELSRKGVEDSGAGANYGNEYLMFVADFSAWRYRAQGGSSGEYPRNLAYRLNSLLLGARDV